VTPRLAQKLKGVGILTVQKLHRTPIDQLVEIEGIGAKTAEKLKNTAAETMVELNKALEDLLKKELQEVEEQKPLFDESIFGPDTVKEKKVEPVITEAELFKNLDDKEAAPSKAEDAPGPDEEPVIGEEQEPEESAAETAEELGGESGEEEYIEEADESEESDEDEEEEEPEAGESPDKSDDASDV
jgi:NAD-dependent DNA ligase